MARPTNALRNHAPDLPSSDEVGITDRTSNAALVAAGHGFRNSRPVSRDWAGMRIVALRVESRTIPPLGAIAGCVPSA